MHELAFLLITTALVILLTTWLGYPIWLRARAAHHPPLPKPAARAWWPSVTIVLVVRNAERSIGSLLNNLLALAYPGDARRILVVSDHSTDFTDAIVRTFEHRGVELLRLMRERGNARAVNAARRYVRSDIVVMMDPEARLAPSTLVSLVAPFAEPSVGVTYGHELRAAAFDGNGKESAYTRYESMLRDGESRVFGTVSARRSLYAMRGPLFHAPAPPWVSPDFLATLLAAEHGYRAVHVTEARCTLERPRSPRRDYARTAWAVGRDALTLLRKPHLLNPRRYGDFSWMLMGHKVGRWLTPWAMLAGYAGVALLTAWYGWARWTAAAGLALAIIVGLLAFIPSRGALSRIAALPGHIAATTMAMAHGTWKALRARTALRNGMEPTLQVSRGPFAA